MSESTYTIRYWGGPKDGAEEQITCGYPPKVLHGYGLAYGKVGRYLYSWAQATRARNGGAK